MTLSPTSDCLRLDSATGTWFKDMKVHKPATLFPVKIQHTMNMKRHGLVCLFVLAAVGNPSAGQPPSSLPIAELDDGIRALTTVANSNLGDCAMLAATLVRIEHALSRRALPPPAWFPIYTGPSGGSPRTIGYLLRLSDGTTVSSAQFDTHVLDPNAVAYMLGLPDGAGSCPIDDLQTIACGPDAPPYLSVLTLIGLPTGETQGLVPMSDAQVTRLRAAVKSPQTGSPGLAARTAAQAALNTPSDDLMHDFGMLYIRSGYVPAIISYQAGLAAKLAKHAGVAPAQLPLRFSLVASAPGGPEKDVGTVLVFSDGTIVCQDDPESLAGQMLGLRLGPDTIPIISFRRLSAAAIPPYLCTIQLVGRSSGDLTDLTSPPALAARKPYPWPASAK